MKLKQLLDENFPIRARSIDHFVELAQTHKITRLVGIPCGNTREVIPSYLHTNCWTEDAYVTFGEVALVGHFQAVFRGERLHGRDVTYLHDYGQSLDRLNLFYQSELLYDFQFLGRVRKTMEEIGARIPGIETKLVYEGASTRKALLGRYEGRESLFESNATA